MADRRTRHDAAYSATGKRKSPLGWLPWAGLLLLFLLGALVFLIVRNVGDDGDDDGIDVTDDPAAAAVDDTDDAESAGDATPGAAGTPTTANGTGAAAPTTTAGGGQTGGGAPAGAAGSLTAGGQALLPAPTAGFGSLEGQPVTGTGVAVESVVADEGFWVGSSSTDRVFVFLTPEARTTDGESPFRVQPGQLVNLTGTLIALPGTADSLGVDTAEGADQLNEQGHLVEVTELTLA